MIWNSCYPRMFHVSFRSALSRRFRFARIWFWWCAVALARTRSALAVVVLSRPVSFSCLRSLVLSATITHIKFIGGIES